MNIWKKLLWIAVSALGLLALVVLALSRGEQISALWIVTAGLCAFAISYRFYSKWLATKVLVLNDERATPAVVQNDGKDFVPTNRWMVFGHHFAAIAGPGPLVGPVLAAQFGFLPGTLWILIGATLGGAVHDMIVLFSSVRRRGKTLGQMVKEEIGRGVGASILPVWLLLTPRDYLSTFLKLGTVAALAVAVILLRPMLLMPSLTKFIDGTGPIFAGPVFPFVCITIACGAVSGFHSLIASGTTPKMLRRECRIRNIGYGAMVTEMMVALMAMIAACVLQPGEYFAINSKGTPTEVVARVSAAGFPVTEQQMTHLASELGESTMFNRAGGAPTFAVGMAHMFARISASPTALALWYHFAIMFEALFILTTIDAGTRVGRFLLQDFLGNIWRPLGNTRSWSANLFSSVLLVAAWGWFLYVGVIDPLGGINSLWPLFGLANQLLSVIALCLGTTILIKMHKAKYLFVTVLPLCFMCAVTFSAGYLKVFSPDPKLGFLSGAQSLLREAARIADPATAADLAGQASVWQCDALVAVFFLGLVFLIVLGSARQWWQLLRGTRRVALHESEFVRISAT